MKNMGEMAAGGGMGETPGCGHRYAGPVLAVTVGQVKAFFGEPFSRSHVAPEGGREEATVDDGGPDGTPCTLELLSDGEGT